MTTLIVKPLDYTAPGSFRQRSRLLRSVALMRNAKDPAEIAAAYVMLEDLALERCATDDGSPVADVLDMLSAEQFDQLMQSIAGESPVPTKSAGN